MSSVPRETGLGERQWVTVLIPAVLIALVTWLLFIRGMARDLNHDEHQFLAPGVLLSREGLLPFRDYPLFHLPNLVFAYAALDKVTGLPLLSAKLLSIAASAGLAATLILLVWREKSLEASVTSRTALAAAAVLLLIFDPVFLFTSGKIWNHEVPTFLICSAIVIQALRSSKPSCAIAILCGLLGGLAAGCRLTFGPMLIPLFVAAWMVPGSLRDKMRHGFAWGVGAFFGLLPSFWLFVTSLEPFMFGNLEFPRLRLSDPTNLRIQKTVRLSAKIRYFFKEIMQPSWPLFLAYLAVAVWPGVNWLRRRGGSAICGFVLVVLPFALFGCFAPSRYQYQHYFGIIGLLSIGVAAGLASVRSWRLPKCCDGSRDPLQANAGEVSVSITQRMVPLGNWAKPRWGMLLSCALIAFILTAMTFRDRKKIKYLYPIIPPPAAEYFAVEFRQRAQMLRTHVQQGPVLTLAPIWPIEAGLSIYPEFATGEFGWRSAHLVPDERRQRLDLVAPEDLERFLAAKPPAAILTGYEDEDVEEPLVSYGKRHGYRRVPLERKRFIWLPENKSVSQNY